MQTKKNFLRIIVAFVGFKCNGQCNWFLLRISFDLRIYWFFEFKKWRKSVESEKIRKWDGYNGCKWNGDDGDNGHEIKTQWKIIT